MKYAVLSVNQNPDYMYFAPLTTWALKRLGWNVIMFYRGDKNELSDLAFSKNEIIRVLKPIEGHRDSTIAQVSRLYASCIGLNDNDYIMTFDIDMLMLSDYLNPNENEISVYGHDLTGYTEYPICYIGMMVNRWRELMQITELDYNKMIGRDLDNSPNSKSDDFYKFWGVDQQIITKRLNECNIPIKSILRGQYKNGYARGRVDRGSWTLSHPIFIDAHLHHQIYHKGNEWKFKQTMSLLYNIWPQEDFTWFEEYHKEFKQLTGHD